MAGTISVTPDTRWSAEPPSLLDADFTVVAPFDALADEPDAPVWPTERSHTGGAN